MPKICNWFTVGSPYEDAAKKNALTFKLAGAEPWSIGVPASMPDNWTANCNLKPQVALQAIGKLKPKEGVLLLDADAEVLRMPDWTQLKSPYFAYVNHIRKSGAREILSGTLWLTATPECESLLFRWLSECQLKAELWDQVNLKNVIGMTTTTGFEPLPMRELDWHWAWIKGTSDPLLEKDAFIRHNQMSRETRKAEAVQPKKDKKK